MRQLPERPLSHRLGDIGQTVVSLTFKKWGWTADLISSDYGEDLDCNIFVNQKRTSFHFRCQVKSSSASSKYVRFLKSGEISVSVETIAARSWLFSYYPVLLIVYNENSEECYWINATHYLKKNLDKISSQKNITIRISSNAQLEENKQEVELSIQEHYAQIFRISSPLLTCKVIPVIMPGYKILEPMKLFEILRDAQISTIDDLEVDSFRILAPHYLPAWTAVLKSLHLSGFPFWNLSMSGIDIEKFDRIITYFSHCISTCDSLKLLQGQWISFIVSPIRILERDHEVVGDIILNQELTEWGSYSFIDKIESDYDYAFQLPRIGLIPQKYNGHAWDFEHLVIPKIDLAVKFFGRHPTTVADLQQKKLFKDLILSNFIAWFSLRREVELLRKILTPLELQFSEIAELSEADYVKGIICDYMFNPNLGLSVMPENWNQIENNSILERLEDAAIFKLLPGRSGGSEIVDYIMNSSSSWQASEYIRTQERDYIPGLPIEHSGRLISVKRYRKIKKYDEEFIQNSLDKGKLSLQEHLDKPGSLGVYSETFWSLSGSQFCILTIYWKPNLNESSLDSFERSSTQVSEIFDNAIPAEDVDLSDENTTFDIVQKYGLVRFEEVRE
ncbi:MAG: DUF4365 domain-containing protein [Leptolyngbya sp. SIO1D8]|nr:DUF4365 domain-containing protein [Leptolyngbya sp. SIO1D8]